MTPKIKHQVTPAKEPMAAPAPMAEAAAPKTNKPRKVATTSKPRPAASKAAPAIESSSTSISILNLHDEIARQAYLYWVERGRLNGSAEEDWLRAEQEVHSRLLSLSELPN